jgi:hypothetical protein
MTTMRSIRPAPFAAALCLTLVLQLLAPALLMPGAHSAAAKTEESFFVEHNPMVRPEAQEATHAYRFQNFIPPAMLIPDGFIDGGRGMKMHGDGRVGSSRELLMVDREKDARLRDMLAYARSREVTILKPRERAVKLAEYLSGICNGTVGRMASADATDALIPMYRGRGVLIGDVVAMCGGASCRHRTLLFKLLADEAGLSVAMVRGRYRHSDGRIGRHAWNEQYLDDGTVLLVDIMSPPRHFNFPAIQEERPKRKYLSPSAEGIYDKPHVVWAPYIKTLPGPAGTRDRVTVEMVPPEKDAPVFYTVDGSAPTEKSARYQKPLVLSEGTTVKAVSVYRDGFSSLLAEKKLDASPAGLSASAPIPNQKTGLKSSRPPIRPAPSRSRK